MIWTGLSIIRSGISPRPESHRRSIPSGASRGQLQLLALMVAHDLVAMLFELFLKILTDLTQFSSDQVRWDVSNPFSAALPAMDSALADTLNDEDAFRMAAAVVKGANWNGFGPMEIANGKFASVPMGGSLELVASFPKRGAVVIRCIEDVSPAPKKTAKRKRPELVHAS
jgi:hypothetical protein